MLPTISEEPTQLSTAHLSSALTAFFPSSTAAVTTVTSLSTGTSHSALFYSPLRPFSHPSMVPPFEQPTVPRFAHASSLTVPPPLIADPTISEKATLV